MSDQSSPASVGWGFEAELESALLGAARRFDLAGRSLRSLLGGANDTVRSAVSRGVRFRCLLLNPDSPFGREESHLSGLSTEAVRRLGPEVELRFTARPVVPAMARVDDLWFVNLAPDGASPLRLSSEAPVLRVARRNNADLFATYSDGFERAWSEAQADELRSDWAQARSALVTSIESIRGASPGRELAAAGFELESAVFRILDSLPAFELTMEAPSGRDGGFDAVAFDLSVGEPLLIDIKGTRQAVQRRTVEGALHLAERLAAHVLLLTTTELTRSAQDAIDRAKSAGYRVSALHLADLATSATADDAVARLRRALA